MDTHPPTAEGISSGLAAVSNAFTTTTIVISATMILTATMTATMIVTVTVTSVFTMGLIPTTTAWQGGADLAGYANRAARATLRCLAHMPLMAVVRAVVAVEVAVVVARAGDGSMPSVSEDDGRPRASAAFWKERV